MLPVHDSTVYSPQFAGSMDTLVSAKMSRWCVTITQPRCLWTGCGCRCLIVWAISLASIEGWTPAKNQSGVVRQHGKCKEGNRSDIYLSLQVWLQEFAWREKDKPGRMQQRNQSMAPEDREIIQQEPMFCFEHCWLCLYWSWLCYDFQEVSEPSLQLSMKGGNLQHRNCTLRLVSALIRLQLCPLVQVASQTLAPFCVTYAKKGGTQS